MPWPSTTTRVPVSPASALRTASVSTPLSSTVRRKPFEPAIRLEYGIVYPTGNELSTAAREFIETIRATAAEVTGTEALGAEAPEAENQLAARSTLGSSLSGNGTGSPRSADKSAAI